MKAIRRQQQQHGATIITIMIINAIVESVDDLQLSGVLLSSTRAHEFVEEEGDVKHEKAPLHESSPLPQAEHELSIVFAGAP